MQTAARAPLNVYVTGYFENNGRLLRTDDCGTSFVTIATSDGSNRAIVVSPYDSCSIAIAAQPPGNYSEDHVALSSDGGTNWTLTDLSAAERIGAATALGWFPGCYTNVFTTAAFRTGKGSQAVPLQELQRQTSNLAQMRAADSHCIGGDSVTVVALHDGVWLHRLESRIFTDGFEMQ